jgi:alkylation response protein AidB-like acyl-CoA dehydrogenase
MPKSTDLLAAARSVAPIVEANAERAEREGALTEEVVAALRAAGLFGLLVPRELGGLEADLPTAIDVLAEVTRADASTGWSLMANATSSAFAAAYTGDAAARAMFCSPGVTGIHAGQLAPRGQAIAADGGYRVSGEYSFASGSSYASWMMAGAFPLDDGQVPMGPQGFPEIRAVCVPKASVEMRGNWSVLGLRGTGSVDYALHDVAVPEEFSFSLLGAETRRGGPLYALGVLTLTASGHASFALGVGRRALDEITAIAQGKQRLGDARLADKPTFQRDLARAEAKQRAARLLVLDTFGEAERTSQRGSALDHKQAQLCRIAATYATEVAAEVTDFAYRLAGSDSLREPSVLGRCFRDVHAATQHIFVDDRTLVDGGAALLGIAPAF